MNNGIIAAALLFFFILLSSSSAWAVPTATVPEPSTLLLIGSGLAGAGAWKIRGYLRK